MQKTFTEPRKTRTYESEPKMTTTVNIQVSDTAIKWLVGGTCFLGAFYLFYKLVENIPENKIHLPEEAKEFSKLPQLSPSKFDDLDFHSEVKESARAAFSASDFSGAVRAACLSLYDLIRRKSGVQADATTLIQKVFRGSCPVLKFTEIAEPHITNAENGLIEMLEGFSKSIRKIHMHSSAQITETDALQEISIICYLAERVENNTVLCAPDNKKIATE